MTITMKNLKGRGLDEAEMAALGAYLTAMKPPPADDAKVFTFVPPRTIRLSKPLGEGELLTITYNTVWTEQVLTWARRSRTPTGRL